MISFFKHLYQFCGEGYMELRALPSGKQIFLKLYDESGLKAFLTENVNQNLFFSVALRNGGGRKEHITQIPCAWCDVDYKDISREDLISKLKNFPFKPSIFVKSGGGVHLYWLLKEAAGKEDVQKIENINRRIATSLDGDLNSCDAARILRIPGTVNHKYSHKPLCEVAEK